MKTFLSTLLFIISDKLIGQQNLIQNPSFEIIDTIYHNKYGKDTKPFASSLINWHWINGTVDLFGDSIELKPPFHPKGYTGLGFGNRNFAGHQKARDGSLYLGLFQYVEQDSPVNKYCLTTESFAGKLKSPLKKDSTYTITIYTSLAEISNVSVKEFKFCFNDSLKVINSINLWCKTLIDTTNSFKLYTEDSTWVNKKEEWVQISGTYKAKGGEKFLYIGIPSPKPKLQEEKVKLKYKISNKYYRSSNLGTVCYYYFDEVSVVIKRTENDFGE